MELTPGGAWRSLRGVVNCKKDEEKNTGVLCGALSNRHILRIIAALLSERDKKKKVQNIIN